MIGTGGHVQGQVRLGSGLVAAVAVGAGRRKIANQHPGRLGYPRWKIVTKKLERRKGKIVDSESKCERLREIVLLRVRRRLT